MLEIEKKVVYIIPSTNRWSDRENKSRIRIVFTVLCQL